MENHTKGAVFNMKTENRKSWKQRHILTIQPLSHEFNTGRRDLIVGVDAEVDAGCLAEQVEIALPAQSTDETGHLPANLPAAALQSSSQFHRRLCTGGELTRTRLEKKDWRGRGVLLRSGKNKDVASMNQQHCLEF